MSQQLHLFPNEPFPEDLPDSISSNGLVSQTRQLFHHQGSNAELIERIKTVVAAINERCQEPNLK